MEEMTKMIYGSSADVHSFAIYLSLRQKLAMPWCCGTSKTTEKGPIADPWAHEDVNILNMTPWHTVLEAM